MRLSSLSSDPDFFIRAHGTTKDRSNPWEKSYLAVMVIHGFPRLSRRKFKTATEAIAYSQHLERRARSYCRARMAWLQNSQVEEAL